MLTETIEDIKDFEIEVMCLENLTPEVKELFDWAIQKLGENETKIKNLEVDKDSLEDEVRDLEDKISDFESNEEGAIKVLEKYADHNNWKDGNVWHPLDWTINREFGDELANKALRGVYAN